ncbi:MAG: hypothetical protein JNK46_12615, partial [Methylobacteriaceae bacterium]|nr:hypothetical protein [Methylobacteriaceae bacterium]
APPDASGFAAGSGVAKHDDPFGCGLEFSGAWGARAGSSVAHGLKLSVAKSPFRCLEIGPSITLAHARASDPVAATTTTTRAIGAGVEIKYKLIGGERFGLTAAFEPTIASSRIRLSDWATPQFLRGDGPAAGYTAKLLFDAAIAPQQLFLAVNLEQGAAFLKDNGVDCATASGSGWCRGSSLTLRAALSYAVVSEKFFVGVDAAHQRAYDGAFLNRAPGWAWFAGPNLFWQISDNVSFNAAFAAQLSGKAPGQTAGSLNLDQFTRYVAKAKLGWSF